MLEEVTDDHYTPQVRVEYALMDIVHGLEYLEDQSKDLLKEYQAELVAYSLKINDLVRRVK